MWVQTLFTLRLPRFWRWPCHELIGKQLCAQQPHEIWDIHTQPWPWRLVQCWNGPHLAERWGSTSAVQAVWHQVLEEGLEPEKQLWSVSEASNVGRGWALWRNQLGWASYVDWVLFWICQMALEQQHHIAWLSWPVTRSLPKGCCRKGHTAAHTSWCHTDKSTRGYRAGSASTLTAVPSSWV